MITKIDECKIKHQPHTEAFKKNHDNLIEKKTKIKYEKQRKKFKEKKASRSSLCGPSCLDL